MSRRSPYLVLLACMFASQAALIVMTPVLAQAAADLGVSVGAAGQLRSVAGLTAALTTLLVPRAARRTSLGRLMLGSCVLLALGSLAAAAAPTFAALAAAQVPVGIAVAVLTTASTLAAAEWAPAGQRARALGWALAGQPIAWIVGLPLVGLVGATSWRAGWLVLPFASAAFAAAAVAPRRNEAPAARSPLLSRAALADAAVARWLVSELLANAGWAGILLYGGALFTDSYGTSSGAVGCLLALVAAAYLGGNIAARRFGGGKPDRALVLLALVLAAGAAAFGLVRVGTAASAVLFSGTAVAGGARTLVTTSFALGLPVASRTAATSLRGATLQLGYFAGSLVAGTALALGGYGSLGVAMSALFALAALVLSTRKDQPMHAVFHPSALRTSATRPGFESRRRAETLLRARSRRRSLRLIGRAAARVVASLAARDGLSPPRPTGDPCR